MALRIAYVTDIHYGPDIGIVTVETLAEGLGSLA